MPLSSEESFSGSQQTWQTVVWEWEQQKWPNFAKKAKFTSNDLISELNQSRLYENMFKNEEKIKKKQKAKEKLRLKH